MVNDVLVHLQKMTTIIIHRDDYRILYHQLTDLKLVEILCSTHWMMHSMLPLLKPPPTTHSLVPE